MSRSAPRCKTKAQNKDFRVWKMDVISIRRAKTKRKMRMSLKVFKRRVRPQNADAIRLI